MDFSDRGILRHPGGIFSLKSIEFGVYADLITIYPTPYSIYLRGTIYGDGKEILLGIHLSMV